MNKPQRVADESITGNNNNNNKKTDNTTDAIAIAPTHTHMKADTHNSVHPTKQPCLVRHCKKE